MSLDNNDLITDLLAGDFLLPYIAARHNVPLSALNAWVESEEVQFLLASCRRISDWRARFIALDSIPRSIHGLITTMDQCPGTEKARRAATTIINLAFKKDPSIPQGATGRARPSERDQCSDSLRATGLPTSSAAHQRSASTSHAWPARSARGSSQTSPSISETPCTDGPVPESPTLDSGTFPVPDAEQHNATPSSSEPSGHSEFNPFDFESEHQDSSLCLCASVVSPLPDSRAPT